jgi:hypothetical protein
MGQLRKRGGVWWMRYYRNGKRYEESAKTDKKEKAREILQRKEGDIANGLPITPKIGRVRFEEAAAAVEADYRINERATIAHVERHKKKLSNAFAGRRLADITGADIRAYTDARKTAGASNATINRELATLKRMYTLAIDGGQLLVKPKIKMLDENNARQGFFERDQFAAVLAHLPAHLRGVATFAFFSGWRKSELLGKMHKRADRKTLGDWKKRPLEWARVDRQARIIRLDVGTTKNKDGREFHYGPIADLVAVIDQHWAEHEALRRKDKLCPFVFQRNGRPVKSFYKAWRAACKAAGCPARMLHDCRRTTVRNLERAGVSRSVAMKLTGHKTEAVYRRYAIVDSGDLADAAGKLQAVTGTISGTIGPVGSSAESQKAHA